MYPYISKCYECAAIFAIIAPSQTQTTKTKRMKTKISKVLWSVLTVSSLSGCTTVQQHPLYSMWQERAYGAYGMPVPAPYVSPFMTTEMPYGAAQGQ